jgi:hypothetical protein
MMKAPSWRFLSLMAMSGILVAGCAWMASGQAPPAAAGVSASGNVVVAELFTSEGCSSCPEADTILTLLLHKQPIDGVTLVGMSEHVDYWNREGWVDPFSSAEFTKRQLDYRNQTFHTDTVFTPQLVVDGRLEEAGNNIDAVYRTLVQAARAPKATVKVTSTMPAAGRTIQVEVKVSVPQGVAMSGKTDMVIAVTEDDLGADVRGGENGGRHLTHSGVVRKLQTIGTLTPETHAWSGSASVALAPEWKAANLKVIGLLQEQESRHIAGAGWSNVAPLAAGR